MLQGTAQSQVTIVGKMMGLVGKGVSLMSRGASLVGSSISLAISINRVTWLTSRGINMRRRHQAGRAAQIGHTWRSKIATAPKITACI